MKVPVSNVVQMPSAQAQPKINPTMLAMAASMMSSEGKLPGLAEDFATWLTGRDLGHRAFYNQTRAGLLNPDTPPDDASPMGGLGQSLKSRRQMQGFEAQDIEDQFFGKGR